MEEGKSFYEQTLSAIFTYTADGALIVDKQDVVVAINDALQKMTGWHPEEIIGKRICHALFGCRCQGTSGEEIFDGNDAYQQRLLTTSQGKTVRVWISRASLPDIRPESPAAIIFVRGVTEEFNPD